MNCRRRIPNSREKLNQCLEHLSLTRASFIEFLGKLQGPKFLQLLQVQNSIAGGFKFWIKAIFEEEIFGGFGRVCLHKGRTDLVIGGRLFLGQKGLGLSQFDLNLLAEEFYWVFPYIGVLALDECLL